MQTHTHTEPIGVANIWGEFIKHLMDKWPFPVTGFNGFKSAFWCHGTLKDTCLGGYPVLKPIGEGGYLCLIGVTINPLILIARWVDRWWRNHVLATVLEIHTLKAQVSAWKAFRDTEINVTPTTTSGYFQSFWNLIACNNLMPGQMTIVAGVHIDHKQTITTRNTDVVASKQLFIVELSGIVHTEVLFAVPWCGMLAWGGTRCTTFARAHLPFCLVNP